MTNEEIQKILQENAELKDKVSSLEKEYEEMEIYYRDEIATLNDRIAELKEKEECDITKMSVRDLFQGENRLINILIKNEIHTIADLLNHSRYDFWKMGGIGNKYQNLIVQKLAWYQLKLKEN